MLNMLSEFYREYYRLSVAEDSVTVSPHSEGALRPGENDSLPLLHLCPPAADPSYFFSCMEKVGSLVEMVKPGGEAEKILAALRLNPAFQDSLFSSFFKESLTLPEDPAINPETYRFLLSHTVQKFMHLYSRKVLPLRDLEKWRKHYCPVCGGKPALAILRKDDGRRDLYCSLCDVRWNYLRMGCPFCLHPESQFITLSGIDMYRIYFCEKCQGYLKTIDESRAGNAPLDMAWEQVSTLFLDALAMKEGYEEVGISP